VDRIVGPSHFSDQEPPLGDRAFTVEVGGMSVRFQGLPEPLFEACLRRYAAFLNQVAPLHSATVRAGETAYLEASPDGYLRLEETEHPEGRVLLSTEMAAFWRRDSRDGVLKLARPDDLKFSLLCMENYLRWVVADLALQHGGFVLHSSGLVRDGKAHVFFGPSGAGKSTVATLSPGCALLSDDLVLLLRTDGRWLAATTPFWGTLPQEAKSAGLYPLAGLYRLVQSSEVRLESLPLAVAGGMLLACCPFVTNPELRNRGLVPLVEDCIRNVPTRSLKFRKEPSFWSIITPEAEHA
jgi:hypothetical protein